VALAHEEKSRIGGYGERSFSQSKIFVVHKNPGYLKRA
jgi:hypothetical protein